MRQIFLDSLFDEMKINQNLFFLTADMGINLVEKFEEEYPDRYLNVGIAEQNLIGVAAGLAESGMIPFVYTISNFLIERSFEQIRNDVVLHNLHVVLVGTSTGFDNFPLGPTHHMVDEWGAVSAFPGIDIFAPYNKVSAKNVFHEVLKNKNPSYVRIAKGGGLTSYSLEENLGRDSKIVTYGSAVAIGEKIAKEQGYDLLITEKLGVKSFEFLTKYCIDSKNLIIVEDHFANTGLYSYVCQWAVANKYSGNIKFIGPTSFKTKIPQTLEGYFQ